MSYSWLRANGAPIAYGVKYKPLSSAFKTLQDGAQLLVASSANTPFLAAKQDILLLAG